MKRLSEQLMIQLFLNVCSHTCVIFILHLRDEVVRVDLLCYGFHLINSAVLQAVFNIVPQGTRKEHGILGNH